MKYAKSIFRSTIFLLLILSFIPASAQIADGTGSKRSGASLAAQIRNPEQIALLRWYGANMTTGFAVGTNPRGVCFDGANNWVANYGSGTVTKLRANDGEVLGTFAVGTQPAISNNAGFVKYFVIVLRAHKCVHSKKSAISL